VKKLFSLLITTILFTGCQTPLNNPYSTSEKGKNIYYNTFYAQPKTLDPARAYSSDEYRIICQIYEPPLQYHYLIRPYKLIPLTTRTIPHPRYFDKSGNLLSLNSPTEKVYRTVYDIQIKQDIFYQNHPSFAKDEQDKFLYHNLLDEDLSIIYGISDFKHTGTRELKADDYIYQIYRIADPRNNSPIFPIMAKYIFGLDTLYNQETDEKTNPIWLDYKNFSLPGVIKKNDYTFQIILKKKYPQILYWLSMPFFSPIPWEAVKFYSQGPLIKKNITLQSYPVGTGPFMIDVFDPNSERKERREIEKQGALMTEENHSHFLKKLFTSLRRNLSPAGISLSRDTMILPVFPQIVLIKPFLFRQKD